MAGPPDSGQAFPPVDAVPSSRPGDSSLASRGCGSLGMTYPAGAATQGGPDRWGKASKPVAGPARPGAGGGRATPAGPVLRGLAVDPARVKETVDRLTGVGRHAGGKIELAPSTEQVLQLAIEEARRMGHHYIGTEHLLLGPGWPGPASSTRSSGARPRSSA